MATLDILSSDSGPLTLINVPLARGQLAERSFYALPAFMDWLANILPDLIQGRWKSTFSPQSQLDALLRNWVLGRDINYPGVIHYMQPLGNGACEMKTDDLRIFGWLYRPKVFIAAMGDYADDYKEPTKTKTYGKARDRVLAEVDALDLDPPKMQTGPLHALL